jgi:hypothetical protein
MQDIAQQYGTDLTIGPTGDLALAMGPALTQQRVLRRLLTNPNDYIWQLQYGAGLGQFVGQTTNPLQVKAVIRSQISREREIAQTPAPIVDVRMDITGALYVSLQYVDVSSGQTQLLSFPIGSGA